jgi:hypothetical protein
LKHVFSKNGFAGEVTSTDVTQDYLVAALVFRDTAANDPSDDRIHYWS